jgi:hypothetical protein
MKDRCWQNLILLGLLVLLPSVCNAQTYQGPSGGYGGKSFDHWNESGQLTDIESVSLLIDNSVIRCISVRYRASLKITKSGYCNPPSDSHLTIDGWQGITLDPDEYIIGIAGRYGARIDSIRFYTNKRSPPSFGSSGGAVEFGYSAPSGQKIVAFFGRASDNLDAIGVMYAPSK